MDSKCLPTTLSYKYDFIEIPEHEQNEQVGGMEVPVYISPKKTPLDKYYNSIEGTIFATSNAKPVINCFTQDKFLPIFRPQDQPDLSTVPNPKNYASFHDFSMAFEQWYRKAIVFFSPVILPNPLSGEFYLISMPKIFERDERNNPGRFRTFKPELWPLLPQNYLDMVDKIYDSNSKIDPDELFKELLSTGN
ncbi:hypothetical protein GPJ56_010804 [Histomonas meleagridis]|nr:hypothetical protein GPJ56_010804 [Histomonas meleagridis]